ncbi:MAG: hypothetical protein ACKOYK_09560 [Cyanobium sp.]
MGTTLAARLRKPGGIAVAQAVWRQRQQLLGTGPDPPVTLLHEGSDGGVGAQGGAGHIGRRGAVTAGEEIEAVIQIGGVLHQCGQVGGEVEQLAAGGRAHGEGGGSR